jgi:nitric oxide reductase large subunit
MKKLIPGIFQSGAVLSLLGAALYITGWVGAPYFYVIGSAMVMLAEIFSPVNSDSVVVRRLHIQQVFGGFFLFASSICMVMLHGNEWIILLAVACVFLLYSTFRLSYELKKKSEE